MHKSRRWLLASMGASAVTAMGSIASADDPKAKAGTCEDLATEVPLGTVPISMPTTPKDIRDALFDAFTLGLKYQCLGEVSGNLSAAGLRALLEKAYSDAIADGEIGSTWILTVLQAHILGQLTQFFWRKLAYPKNKPLKPRHLLAAWNHFHRATSSTYCKEYICAVSLPDSRKAYVLPKVNVRGVFRIFQLDQPCPLC